MPDTHTTSVDQQRLEKERIEDDGTVTLTRGGHAIHCLTVIGQVEGHTEAPQGQKTTKYEHVIPQLAAVQEDPRIEGLLVLLNTVGGDVDVYKRQPRPSGIFPGCLSRSSLLCCTVPCSGTAACAPCWS